MVAIVLQALSAVAQLAAVAGIIFLYREIQLNKSAIQCHLINDLEKEFSHFYSIFAKLKEGGVWEKSAVLSSEDIAQLENLASFCEKLKHFRDRGVLDWKTLDLMFRNRFFIIVRNPNVIKHVIEPCRSDWETLLTLEKEWRNKLPVYDPRGE